MPEATFQAWFAHRLIGPFPMRRVVREPDFDPQRSTSPHRLGFRTSVHLDIAITRHDGVELPRRAATARGPGGWDSLRDLTIISELKVGSSTIGGLTYGTVAQDYRKLSMFLDEADVPHRHCGGVTAFMCILDNHPTAKTNPKMIRKRLDGVRAEITTLWWSAHGTRWDDGW